MVSLTKQKHGFPAVLNPLPGAQFGAFARLGNAVDADRAGVDLGMGKSAGMTQTGGFEHLV